MNRTNRNRLTVASPREPVELRGGYSLIVHSNRSSIIPAPAPRLMSSGRLVNRLK